MVSAIILAAGSGKRMQSDVAKQYIRLAGRELIYYALATFQNNANIDEIVLVVRNDETAFCKENIVERYGFTKVQNICAGGEERYHSVYKGLLATGLNTENNKDVVMIHDGARPFVSDEMINASIDAVLGNAGACTVGVPVKDTIKVVEESEGELLGIRTPDRKKLYQIQTPQTFRYGLLMSAYEKMFADENHNITDDSMLVEQYEGVLSKIIPGAYENLKITTPEDLEIAEKFVGKFFDIF